MGAIGMGKRVQRFLMKMQRPPHYHNNDKRKAKEKWRTYTTAATRARDLT